MSPSPADPETFVEPSWLRLLRGLVIALTVVMIAGIVVITTLMVLRYNNRTPALPDTITLPAGTVATAFTRGPDWYAVVTEADEILVFDLATGALRQTIRIESSD